MNCAFVVSEVFVFIIVHISSLFIMQTLTGLCWFLICRNQYLNIASKPIIYHHMITVLLTAFISSIQQSQSLVQFV